MRKRCWGREAEKHHPDCREGRPLCRWRRKKSCSCPAYHYPHRERSGRCGNASAMDAHVYGPRSCALCGVHLNADNADNKAGENGEGYFCVGCGRDIDREEAKRAEYEKRNPYQAEGFDDEPYYDGGRRSDASGRL